MTTTRTQFRAECSCCGREQAVDGAGRIADHGYTLDYGWRYGRCEGSRRPHFGLPEGRDLRKTIVESLNAASIRLHERAEAAESGVIKLQRTDKVTKQMVTLTGSALRNEIAVIKQHADQMASEARRMDWSVANWIGRAARPVQIETGKVPTMHFYRERWGKWCAGSAMGARKGRVTSDWSHVNCPKCLARREHFAKQGRAV
jgi:hypothetical protein